MFVCLGLGVWGCNSGPVYACALTLHSHKCSFEIGRSCDSSSRMSWLDVGRLWGLLQCERASSDNLSSSLGDDSLRVMQLRDVTWENAAFRAYRNQSWLVKGGFPQFICLFFLSSSEAIKAYRRDGKSDSRLYAFRVWTLRFVCVSWDQEEEEGAEEGESEFVDTDTDGIVYLLWPRLDFQRLTCGNPHSVHSAPRVAQTSHWGFTGLLCYCWCPALFTIPGVCRTVRCLQLGQAPEASQGLSQIHYPPPSHTDTHTNTQTTHQEGFSRLIATTDFVILNLSHTDTLLKFKHMVFISNPCSVLLDFEIFWWKTEYERKTQRQGWFPDGQSGSCGLKSQLDTCMHTTWTFTHIYQYPEASSQFNRSWYTQRFSAF